MLHQGEVYIWFLVSIQAKTNKEDFALQGMGIGIEHPSPTKLIIS
jgi:hypothetical protein